MNKNMDLRVVKTFEKLRIALADMLTEMTFDNISVFDLCARAEIRRATFYKHFNDKYDFLSYIVGYVQDSLTKKVSADFDVSTPVEYISYYVKQIIAYFNLKDEILANIFNSQTYTSVYNVIVASTYNALVETLNSAIKNGVSLPTDVEFAAGFINGGLAYLIVDFMRYRKISEDELIAKCSRILKKILN